MIWLAVGVGGIVTLGIAWIVRSAIKDLRDAYESGQ
jgi:hypothetical protein